MKTEEGDGTSLAGKGAAAAPGIAAPDEPAPKARNGRRRLIIMLSVPLLIALVGGYFWFTGGRYLTTDNAYVQQARVTISPQVSGRIVATPVGENDAVAAGDVLFVVDPEPYRISLAAAEAALASARLQVEELRAAHNQAEAAVASATDSLDFARRVFERQQGLRNSGVASQAAFDQAENNLHVAEQALTQAKERKSSAIAALGGDIDIATDRHPLVLAASARRDQAALDLDNTTVTAPAAGIVSQTDRLQVGQPVSPSVSVLALVETGTSWIEANFKETDLAKMVPGQRATIAIDAWPGHEIEGEVASIGAGTGAEFSLLPAQNATGNWVKVVQRVPVRVRLVDPPEDLRLRIGLSAEVTVDTESGPGSASAATR